MLSGLAGGDIKSALANGAVPYLATGLKLITRKDTPSDEQMAVRLLSHAIIGGVVAELNGAPAAGGAVGAVSGEVAAITISKLYFGKPPSELNESEREQLSGMSTVCRFIVMVSSPSVEWFSSSCRLTVRGPGIVLFCKGAQRLYTLAEQVVTGNDYRKLTGRRKTRWRKSRRVYPDLVFLIPQW